MKSSVQRKYKVMSGCMLVSTHGFKNYAILPGEFYECVAVEG